MNLTNFTEMIGRNLNNPDCAFTSGMVFGQIISLRLIFYILAIVFLILLFNKLLNVVVNYIINKLKKKSK